MNQPVLWCMQAPNGMLFENTLSLSRTQTLFEMFDEMPPEFRKKYWKRREASFAAYRRLGYRPIRVKIVPA